MLTDQSGILFFGGNFGRVAPCYEPFKVHQGCDTLREADYAHLLSGQ